MEGTTEVAGVVQPRVAWDLRQCWVRAAESPAAVGLEARSERSGEGKERRAVGLEARRERSGESKERRAVGLEARSERSGEGTERRTRRSRVPALPLTITLTITLILTLT